MTDDFFVLSFPFCDDKVLRFFVRIEKFIDLKDCDFLSFWVKIEMLVVLFRKIFKVSFCFIFMSFERHFVKKVVKFVGFDVEKLHFC